MEVSVLCKKNSFVLSLVIVLPVMMVANAALEIERPEQSAVSTEILPSSLPMGRIDINLADAKTFLWIIKGLGRRRAQAIVADRDQYGPFTSLCDLARVPSITQAFVAKYHKEWAERLYVNSDVLWNMS